MTQLKTNWGKARKLLREHGLNLVKTLEQRHYAYYAAKTYARSTLIVYYGKRAFSFIVIGDGIWASYFNKECSILKQRLSDLGFMIER